MQAIPKAQPSRKSAQKLERAPKLKALSKADLAYQGLRERIISGAYKPGHRLRLSHLAREFGTSEMPVREAMRLLEREGLVVLDLHRGAKVAVLSLEQGYQLTEIRVSLECLAGAQALLHHNEASERELRRLFNRLTRRQNQPMQFALYNRKFFELFVARTTNVFLKRIISDLWDQAWRYSSIAVYEFMPNRIGETVAENRDLLASVKEKDLAACSRILAQRKDRILKGWWSAVEKERRK